MAATSAAMTPRGRQIALDSPFKLAGPAAGCECRPLYRFRVAPAELKCKRLAGLGVAGGFCALAGLDAPFCFSDGWAEPSASARTWSRRAAPFAVLSSGLSLSSLTARDLL